MQSYDYSSQSMDAILMLVIDLPLLRAVISTEVYV